MPIRLASPALDRSSFNLWLAAALLLTFFAGAQQASASASSPAANFGTVNVGSTSAAITLVFTFDTSSEVGSAAVLTQGVPDLDFADTGTGTCDSNGSTHVYSTGSTCTILVTFKPARPGLRYGAAILHDNSGNIIATGYLQGMGSAPQVNFLPSTETTVNSNIGAANGLAFDGNGNLYVASWGVGLVEESWTGSGYTESTILGGLGFVSGIAVDGAGNIYLAQWTAGNVIKFSPSPSGYTATTIVTGLSEPNGLAVDGSGNLYISDTGNMLLREETLSNGVYTQSWSWTCNVGGYCSPSGVAIDGKGDLFVSAYENSQIAELIPTAGGYTQTLIGDGLSGASDIKMDASGSLYIADTLNSRVVKETLSDGAYVQSTVATSPLDWPWAVAVDPNGNLFISDTYDHRILKEDYFDPPSLTFASTALGSTSKDSPKTVTVQDTGNAALSFRALNYPEDFPEDASADQNCTASTSLALNGACTLTIDFKPVTPPVTGSRLNETVAITTNNLNIPADQQSVAVSGQVSGYSNTSTTLAASANPSRSGTLVTFTATVTNTKSGPTPTGTVTFTSGNTTLGTVGLVDGVATVSTRSLPAGTDTITATYSGDSNYLTSSAQLNETVFGRPANISAASGSGQSTVYGSAFAEPLVALVTDANGNAVPGVVVSFSGSGLRFSLDKAITDANGQASISAKAVSSGTLDAQAKVPGVAATASFTLNATKPALTVTARNVSVAYGKPLPALTYSISGLVNGDKLSVVSGSAAESTTAIVGSGEGTFPILVQQGTLAAANYIFQFVDGTLTVTSGGRTAKPTFFPPGNTYPSGQIISLADATAGAAIYYTTDAPHRLPIQSSTHSLLQSPRRKTSRLSRLPATTPKAKWQVSITRWSSGKVY